jgi:uncharacterized repeat protein (TIGR04052 family)
VTATMASRMSCWVLLLAAAGCGAGTAGEGGQPVRLSFALEVGGVPFECGARYSHVGNPPRDFAPTDARWYLHDFTLLDAAGTEYPLTLDEGRYQGAGVALLDFETGCGGAGSPEMHTEVTGRATVGDYTQVRFTLGVPEAKNFLDFAAARPPLDVSGLFWVWQFGYTFLRVDAATPQDNGTLQSFEVHVASAACPGTHPERPPIGPCSHPNRPTFNLGDFSPERDEIVADLGHLLGASDLLQNTRGTAPGCSSDGVDPDCDPILARLGVPDSAQQVFFRVRVRP